jgi:hypothetical protein
MESALKRLAVISAFAGAGAVLMGALVAGAGYSYVHRPSPAKPWNTTSLKVRSPPSASVSADLKHFKLEYVLENVSDRDYRIAEAKQFRMVAEDHADTLSGEFDIDELLEPLPLFLPAHARARVTLKFETGADHASRSPKQLVNESEDHYRQELVRLVNDGFAEAVKSFRVYDDVYHYLLVFPCCSSQKPEEPLQPSR